MLSTLPSILNRPPVPAVDAAPGRVAGAPREPREAHAGFATLLQQQADLRAAALRSIDLQAAALGRPALRALPPRPPPVVAAQPAAASAAGGPRSVATAAPAKATEPAPRSDQAGDPASQAPGGEASAASRSPARPGAEARAAERAARAAHPPAAAPAPDPDAAAEQTATADRTAATPGDRATLLANRNRLAARAQAGGANALALPRAGAEPGLATAADRAVGADPVNTDAAGITPPDKAAAPDASQVPTWLQGQALVTGWRPAPAAAPAAAVSAAPLALAAQADAMALPAGPAAAPSALSEPSAAAGAAARRPTAATPSRSLEPRPITDATQLPAATASLEAPATLPAPTTPALPTGLPEPMINSRPPGLAADVAVAQTTDASGAATARTGASGAAAGPGAAPPLPSVTGTNTDATATDRKPTITAQDRRQAAGPGQALERATAASTATTLGAGPTADPAADSGASGRTVGAAATAVAVADVGPAVSPPTQPTAQASAAPGGRAGDGSRAPIGAASGTVRSGLAANEAGVTAATHLPAPGAAGTAATAATAVLSPALTTPGDAALPAPRSQGPFGLRPEAEQLAANGAAARPHTPEDRPAPLATTALPTAVAGLTATAYKVAQAAQAELRASATAVDPVRSTEPSAASMAAAAATVSGSAAAPALSANGSATTAPVPAEATIAVPLDSPAFAPALGAQISLFTRDGVQTARLQLNPPEMGPITVQIALDGSAARVDFQADLASTRVLIEASLPALAGALQEAGMTLAGGGVSQQPSSHQPPPQAEHPVDPRRGEDRTTGTAAQSLPTRVHTHSRGLVDLVA